MRYGVTALMLAVASFMFAPGPSGRPNPGYGCHFSPGRRADLAE